MYTLLLLYLVHYIVIIFLSVNLFYYAELLREKGQILLLPALKFSNLKEHQNHLKGFEYPLLGTTPEFLI